ncbi:GNAT family N-acetyltransferase [Spirosoma sp. KNUC1025]|uniref:GNAT family N-acetyltransferase n=1 Tax=Spirosoma sp. KNUC1025 TaxID=2894082 RepID=UPI00386F192D|nr:GNAT family N-acetyltransferase [Spirosoma sp. KNUC1025]
MTDYSIQLQYNPPVSNIAQFCQHGFFFNEPAHLCQQSDGPFYLLTALNQRTGLTEARCAFFPNADKAVSPIAAPFGSIEFADTLPEPTLDAFLKALITAVQSIGTFARLQLTNYPACYAPSQASRLVTKLSEHGFQIIQTNPTFYLATKSDFAQAFAPAERRRLRKCREAGFQFQQCASHEVLNVVRFLYETRRQQGYTLTIAPAKLEKLLQTFPEQFPVFTVTDGPKLAALTVAVRVREDILYTFLPASHPDYRTFSPMVMLTDGLVSYGRERNIRLLDLGTSLDENQLPKLSLMRFKRNLGARESPKLVFEKCF